MRLSLSCRAVALGVIGLIAAGNAALAQPGLPPGRFGTSDIRKLQWIEGRWRGSAEGQRPFYEAYRAVNDSTIEITYYADSTFTRTTGGGRVYLSVGRVFHTAGPGVWGASRIDDQGVYFVPERNARNTLSWARRGPDTWIATLRSSATGQEQVTIYEMHRIR